jgi:non-lysosomal glucosylceramidase
MSRFEYTSDARRTISFPLGGIGTGCIGLGGTGQLIDWEIFNRPNKGGRNGFTHFAVKAERSNRVIDARVLHADSVDGFMGEGFGMDRYTLEGLPHFRDCTFTGKFPMATINFQDEAFPGEIAMSAFNPLIPSDARSSSLPAAFFTLHVRNNQLEETDYVLLFTVENPLKGVRRNDRLANGVLLRDDSAPDHFEHGKIAVVACTELPVVVQQYWYKQTNFGFDNLNIYWNDLTRPGDLQNRVYSEKDNVPGQDIATISVRIALRPGEKKDVRFLLVWYFPNCYNYWSPKAPSPFNNFQPLDTPWKNYYATLFPDVETAAKVCAIQWDELEERTRHFVDLLYGCDLPEVVIDAIAANLAVLKSPTCLRLENGEFYSFEGVGPKEGSCEGSCAHVWNYAFALAFLFPELERSMRELELTYSQRPNGSMAFRLQLPLGSHCNTYSACVDGQMGVVIKACREWLISGDDEWLKHWWPCIQRALEFAWSPDNEDHWDPGATGVITGRQHNTLDMDMFGPNAWMESFYLAALKAGAKMARAVGDEIAAQKYERMFECGRAFTDRELFNGRYYIQQVDITDYEVLRPYLNGVTILGLPMRDVYWNDELGEIKYQVGEGCLIDQVLGQWMASVAGLGEVLDADQVRTALHSIYKNNYLMSMRGVANPCRFFAVNDERGTIICSWPEETKKPGVPIMYAQECMPGFEYQAAAHMISMGLEKEGLDVVEAVRSRHDGYRRNPWNEMECGSNYVRSLASYGLLLAYSGFRYDVSRKLIGFEPPYAMKYRRFFWALDGAWGCFMQSETGWQLGIAYGRLTVQRIVLAEPELVHQVRLDGALLNFRVKNSKIVLDEAVSICEGGVLEFARKYHG